MQKSCPKCNRELPFEAFGKDAHGKFGLSNRCLECNKIYEAERRRANPDVHRAKVKKWAARNSEHVAAYRESYRERRREIDAVWQRANREKVNEKSRRWRERNREKVAEYNRRYRAENAGLVSGIKREWNERNPAAVAAHGAKRRANPKYKLEATIRTRLHATLAKGAKSARTFDALGFTIDDLRHHLERQFTRGMTWANYGEWHVDHILPLSGFSYETPNCPDFRAAWALSNIRPLWAGDNIKKGAKRQSLL